MMMFVQQKSVKLVIELCYKSEAIELELISYAMAIRWLVYSRVSVSHKSELYQMIATFRHQRG